MKLAGPFDREFWITDEPKVVPLFRNRDDAILQARTSAQALEEDREATRREQRRAAIRKQIDELNMANGWAELDIARRNDLIHALRVEDQLLGVPRHV